MDIIQVVGYKNSGKTTLAQKLINSFSKLNKRCASLKHHGHGGVPLGIKETDSEKHQQAGAIIAGVEGDGVLQLAHQASWELEQMLTIYQHFNIDVLIIEGFKSAHYEKIVLIAHEKDLPLLEQVTNIKAVVTPLSLEKNKYPYPIFKKDESEVLINWLVSTMNF